MLGVHANYADNLTTSGVNALGNNTEHFNSSPVSGGFKITRTRGITVAGGQFRDNDGPGLWLDESTYNSKIVGNKLMNNSSHGVSVELSSTSMLVEQPAGRQRRFRHEDQRHQLRADLEQHVDQQRPADQHRAGRPPGQ